MQDALRRRRCRGDPLDAAGEEISTLLCAPSPLLVDGRGETSLDVLRLRIEGERLDGTGDPIVVEISEERAEAGPDLLGDAIALEFSGEQVEDGGDLGERGAGTGPW